MNELKIEEMSENAVRQSVKRLVANGFLDRYDNGIYYIPKQDGLLDKSYLDPVLVIMRKYVRNAFDTYGYVTGMMFANQLGLTTQVLAIIEFVTNRESTHGRTITVGSQKVRIKKAAIAVSDNNAELLQLLDGLGRAEKYTELSMEETIESMSAYVKGKGYTREQIAGVASVITAVTAKKLIEWGLIYEFVSKLRMWKTRRRLIRIYKIVL